jgi:NAD-dependent deacetylase
MIHNAIEDLAAKFKKASSVAVLTGAGMSAESGVPTFRDAQTGLWARFKPTELATPTAFKNDPKLVWEWYLWRRKIVAEAQPHAGHRALVDLEAIAPKFTLITQNVDSLHQVAGSKCVFELHGNITRARCTKNGMTMSVDDAGPDVPPLCPECGELLRPDVVWFTEPLPAHALAEAERAARQCDLFLSIGTSAQVYPAAALPFTAKEAGADVFIINPDASADPHTPHITFIQGNAGAILPELVAMLK